MSAEPSGKRLRTDAHEHKVSISDLRRAIVERSGDAIAKLIKENGEDHLRTALERLFESDSSPEVLVEGLVDATKRSYTFLNTVLGLLPAAIRERMILERRRMFADSIATEFNSAAKVNTSLSLEKCQKIIESDKNQGLMLALKYWLREESPARGIIWMRFVKQFKEIMLYGIARDPATKEAVFSVLRLSEELRQLVCDWVGLFENASVSHPDTYETFWDHVAKLRALCCPAWTLNSYCPVQYCEAVVREYAAEGEAGRKVLSDAAEEYIQKQRFFNLNSFSHLLLSGLRTHGRYDDRTREQVYNFYYPKILDERRNFHVVAQGSGKWASTPTTPLWTFCNAVVDARDVLLGDVTPGRAYAEDPVSEQLMAIRMAADNLKPKFESHMMEVILWAFPFTAVDPTTYAKLLLRITYMRSFVGDYLGGILRHQSKGFSAEVKAQFVWSLVNELQFPDNARDTIQRLCVAMHMPEEQTRIILRDWVDMWARWSQLRRAWTLMATPGGRALGKFEVVEEP